MPEPSLLGLPFNGIWDGPTGSDPVGRTPVAKVVPPYGAGAGVLPAGTYGPVGAAGTGAGLPAARPTLGTPVEPTPGLSVVN